MLKLQNISKSFSGVKALKNVSLQFKLGEVHALCGENGAGKTTLMNIISGNLASDHGQIFWNEKEIKIDSVLESQSMGISIVHQEKSLVDSLSISENIYPVNQPTNRIGLIDHAALTIKTNKLLQELQLKNLRPSMIVEQLSSSQKSMVEIAKALARNPKLLILDEPTASITHQETEVLFTIIRKLKEKGVGIIYISHRMSEIQQIADIVSVLKDGKYQGTVDGKTPIPEIVRMMVGRELLSTKHESHSTNQIRLQVENISGKGFSEISFSLYKGEILGFAGLLGSGRTEMARAIFGDTKINKGAIFLNGKKYNPHHPLNAIDAGIAYLPDERKTEGLFLEKSVAENIISTGLKQGFYREKQIFNKAKNFKDKLDIRTPTVKHLVRKLSGGNQQKVVLAKWMALKPELLIVNEPTLGVDVGAKTEIYKILKGLTAKLNSVLLISSELSELLLLSDRIAVMYNGGLKTILDKSEATEEKITAFALGIN